MGDRIKNYVQAIEDVKKTFGVSLDSNDLTSKEIENILIFEDATAGATACGNIASVVGGGVANKRVLHDGEPDIYKLYGMYSKKKKKPVEEKTRHPTKDNIEQLRHYDQYTTIDDMIDDVIADHHKGSEAHDISEDAGSGTFVGVHLSPETVDSIMDWAKENGIQNPEAPDELHVTLVLTKTEPINYNPVETYDEPITVEPSKCDLEMFGRNHDTLVITMSCPELERKHKKLRKRYDIPWDFDEYHPHVSVALDVPDINIDDLYDIDFPIVLTGEFTESFSPDPE